MNVYPNLCYNEVCYKWTALYLSYQVMIYVAKLLSYDRWKEECTSIAQKYEDKLKDTRAEVTQVKKRNSEVTKLLKDSQEKLLQVGKKAVLVVF